MQNSRAPDPLSELRTPVNVPNNTEYIATNDLLIMSWQEHTRKRSWRNMKYYSGIAQRD